MKIYRTKTDKLVAFYIFFCLIIIMLIVDKQTLPLFWRNIGIIASLIWVLIGFPISLSYSIRIDKKGISNLYILGQKIFRIRQSIKWEDVVEVIVNEGGTIGIVPKIQDGKSHYKFKDIILITKNIKDREGLIREVVLNAKNAKISDSVKLIVEEKGIGKKEKSNF